MKLKQILLALLIIIAIVMIVMGVKANMKPPILTGVGFIIITALFSIKEKT
jgi:hypothetical protein